MLLPNWEYWSAPCTKLVFGSFFWHLDSKEWGTVHIYVQHDELARASSTPWFIAQADWWTCLCQVISPHGVDTGFTQGLFRCSNDFQIKPSFSRICRLWYAEWDLEAFQSQLVLPGMDFQRPLLFQNVASRWRQQAAGPETQTSMIFVKMQMKSAFRVLFFFFLFFFNLSFHADVSFNKWDGWKLNSKTIKFLLS